MNRLFLGFLLFFTILSQTNNCLSNSSQIYPSENTFELVILSEAKDLELGTITEIMSNDTYSDDECKTNEAICEYTQEFSMPNNLSVGITEERFGLYIPFEGYGNPEIRRMSEDERNLYITLSFSVGGLLMVGVVAFFTK